MLVGVGRVAGDEHPYPISPSFWATLERGQLESAIQWKGRWIQTGKPMS
jgi:hypothetical protein